jgi:hypothetical protein
LRYSGSRVFIFVFFMQKLKGTSSGKNNKSCRNINSGSKKIGFAFFWFFYDFLRNLQETAKALLLFEFPIAGRPSKRTSVSQCGPWAGRPARLAGIEPLRWRPWPGNRWRRLRGSPTVDLRPRMGWGAPGNGRPVAPRRAGRGAPLPGGALAWEKRRWCWEGRRGAKELWSSWMALEISEERLRPRRAARRSRWRCRRSARGRKTDWARHRWWGRRIAALSLIDEGPPLNSAVRRRRDRRWESAPRRSRARRAAVRRDNCDSRSKAVGAEGNQRLTARGSCNTLKFHH